MQRVQNYLKKQKIYKNQQSKKNVSIDNILSLSQDYNYRDNYLINREKVDVCNKCFNCYQIISPIVNEMVFNDQKQHKVEKDKINDNVVSHYNHKVEFIKNIQMMRSSRNRKNMYLKELFSENSSEQSSLL